VDKLEHLLSDLEIVNASRAEAIARGEWTPGHDARRDRVRKLVNEYVQELLKAERERCAALCMAHYHDCILSSDRKEAFLDVAREIRGLVESPYVAVMALRADVLCHVSDLEARHARDLADAERTASERWAAHYYSQWQTEHNRAETAERERDEALRELDSVANLQLTTERKLAETVRGMTSWYVKNRARARLWKRAAKMYRKRGDDFAAICSTTARERDGLKARLRCCDCCEPIVSGDVTCGLCSNFETNTLIDRAQKAEKERDELRAKLERWETCKRDLQVAVGLLHMLDDHDARHPDVAAFLDEYEARVPESER
jgi:hypothetical protein